MNNFKLEDLMPMTPDKGPPLPRFLVIYWPWYKEKPPPPGTYRLTVFRVGNGTVTPGSGDYTAGTTVTLSAVPDTGAVFDHWEGAATGTSPTVNILLDSDKEITAYFTGGPPGANFTVSDLSISPTEVNPGQVVTISCTLTNIGSVAGTKTISLGGDFMAQQSVTLNPGESKVVSFEVTPDVAKTYSVSVDGLTGSFIATTVPVADIRAENLVISPAEVNVGQKVTISVTAKNYGAAAGTKTITCNVT